MPKRRGRTKRWQASRGAEGQEALRVRQPRARVSSKTGDIEKLGPRKKRLPFVAFMERLHVEGLDLNREADHGRDVDLIG